MTIKYQLKKGRWVGKSMERVAALFFISLFGTRALSLSIYTPSIYMLCFGYANAYSASAKLFFSSGRIWMDIRYQPDGRRLDVQPTSRYLLNLYLDSCIDANSGGDKRAWSKSIGGDVAIIIKCIAVCTRHACTFKAVLCTLKRPDFATKSVFPSLYRIKYIYISWHRVCGV